MENYTHKEIMQIIEKMAENGADIVCVKREFGHDKRDDEHYILRSDMIFEHLVKNYFGDIQIDVIDQNLQKAAFEKMGYSLNDEIKWIQITMPSREDGCLETMWICK